MIKEFRGQYYFLSNFYNAKVEWEGITYLNNESAFQSAKVTDFETRLKFANLDPSSGKRKGRNIQLRHDWEKVKFDIMYEIVKAKFTQNEDLKAIVPNNNLEILKTLGYTNMAISKAKNLYILSEAGFLLYLTFADLCVNKYIDFIKEYFEDDNPPIALSNRKEIDFIDKLKESLKPLNIIDGQAQYIVKNENGTNYRIDYYIPSLNVAIEYDEDNHKNYTYNQHEGRQAYIENKLGSKFIRVSDKESDEYNIGVVLKEIVNLKKYSNEDCNNVNNKELEISFNVRNEYNYIKKYFKNNKSKLSNILNFISSNFDIILSFDLYLCKYHSDDCEYITFGG